MLKLLSDNHVMDYSFLFGVSRPRNVPVDPNEEQNPNEKKHISIFRKDGGLVSVKTEELYFFSIIDIFQEWNMRKKMENSIKSLMYEASEISAVNPILYRDRFLKFLRALIE